MISSRPSPEALAAAASRMVAECATQGVDPYPADNVRAAQVAALVAVPHQNRRAS